MNRSVGNSQLAYYLCCPMELYEILSQIANYANHENDRLILQNHRTLLCSRDYQAWFNQISSYVEFLLYTIEASFLFLEQCLSYSTVFSNEPRVRQLSAVHEPFCSDPYLNLI